MKAEERHRLHENELHRLTEHARHRAQPFFERYGTTLLLALAAVLVVAAVLIWWFRSRDADGGRGWDDLAATFRTANPTAEDFADVAVNHPGTKAATWATLYAGEAHLSTGVESLFSDKDGALRDLKSAQESFEAILDQKDVTPEITVRALYGLARTLEATSDGDLKPAIDRYQQIVDDYPESVHQKLAQERLDALKSSDAKAFYSWFSKQKPSPSDPLRRPFDTGSPPATPTPGGAGPALTPSGEAAGTIPVEAPKPAAASGSPE